MKLGVHANAWSRQWKVDPVSVIAHVKELGFDFIEIPLNYHHEFDLSTIKNTLVELKLEACTSTIIVDDELDITSDNEEYRKKGIEYLKNCIRITSGIGAQFFSGIIYAKQFKKTSAFPDDTIWNYSIEGLKEVARYAQDFGIEIGVEPVNRFETCLINTCEQALFLKQKIGEPNIKLHLDTFHMHIEEKNLYDTIKLAGSYLAHLHLNENHLGVAGTGQVNWHDLFRALKEMDYKGYASIESVIETEGNYVWRPLAANSDELVTKGQAFFKDMIERMNRNV